MGGKRSNILSGVSDSAKRLYYIYVGCRGRSGGGFLMGQPAAQRVAVVGRGGLPLSGAGVPVCPVPFQLVAGFILSVRMSAHCQPVGRLLQRQPVAQVVARAGGRGGGVHTLNYLQVYNVGRAADGVARPCRAVSRKYRLSARGNARISRAACRRSFLGKSRGRYPGRGRRGHLPNNNKVLPII